MATRSLRVQRLISPQWGQSDPPSAASACAGFRQMTHDSCPSEDLIGSTQERQSRVILVRSSPEHSRGREGVSAAACTADHALLVVVNVEFILIQLRSWMCPSNITEEPKLKTSPVNPGAPNGERKREREYNVRKEGGEGHLQMEVMWNVPLRSE
ncbi:hypothetical protein G5714_023926 [Onychostoma macrolepis]|uniref:Uncharacterized protein n=1 Tax=Onychostoma macrolepis TaxID=369639 RepID=A0A7J6BII4_9TELE|nr:hypothetical protein G5714_023926 [Onychostoma macrolepis]